MKRFRRVNVEISNICNLKCSFCPEVKRDKQIMSPEFFAHLLPQLAPITDEICLHLMGEPLGHPEFARIVELCEEHQLPINLTTNGVLLNSDRPEILLKSIFRQINFSVHSFVANFPGRDVRPYMSKIFRFAARAQQLRPDLYINYRIWDLSDPQSLSDENALVRELIAEQYQFDFSELKVDLRRKKGFRLGDSRVYLNFDSRFDWPSLDLAWRSEVGTCHALNTHFGILADGQVVPCCLDKEAVISLGNLHHQTLHEILHSDRAQAMRLGFDRGLLVEELCKHCSFVSRFDRKALRLASQPKSFATSETLIATHT